MKDLYLFVYLSIFCVIYHQGMVYLPNHFFIGLENQLRHFHYQVFIFSIFFVCVYVTDNTSSEEMQ